MIGGEHLLPVAAPVVNSMAATLSRHVGPATFFASGRDALHSLLAALPGRAVYVPDLICRSVFEACRSAGKDVIFYATGAELAGHGLPAVLASEACVVVMHYFGRANLELLRTAGRAGATVISDLTHMLFAPESLDEITHASTYVFASLRKSGPFPDGGFVASRHGPAVPATGPVRDDFVAYRAAGLLSRGFSALQNFADEENLRWTRMAEALLDASEPADHRASFLSQALLGSVAMDGATARTARNMQVLAALLSDVCVCFSRAEAPSPYFLCTFASKAQRDQVRTELFRHRYFFPVHWDTSWQGKSHPFSDTGLSIPCDARYSDQQMHAAAEVILSCLA